mgnify:CR=1 FL=1
MMSDTRREFFLCVSADVAAAVLEGAWFELGGNRLSPALVPSLVLEEGTKGLIRYLVVDNKNNRAALEFYPLPAGSRVVITLNETLRYAWILGEWSRSELDKTTILSGEESAACNWFCERFLDHLRRLGYVKDDVPRKADCGVQEEVASSTPMPDGLSEDDQTIWQMYARGATASCIANRLALTEKRVLDRLTVLHKQGLPYKFEKHWKLKGRLPEKSR